MRVRDGNFSYEVYPVTDSATLLFSHYRVIVFNDLSGRDTVVFDGKASNLDEAKEIGEREVNSAQQSNTDSKVTVRRTA